MATNAHIGRGYTNVSALRRKLRRMPDLVEKNIKPKIEAAAQAIAQDLRDLTPDNTGLLESKQDYKVSRDGLAARIGVRTQVRAKAVFYFKFLDGGTKGDPALNIPPMPALHIRTRAFDANRDKAVAEIRDGINQTLNEVTHE